MRLVKPLFPIFFILICVAASAAEIGSSGDQFWHNFRQAVLANNVDQVSSLTRFPFEVRGPDDSDPVKNYNRKSFGGIFKRVVVQPVLLPIKGKFITKSMLQVIDDKKEITDKDYMTPEAFQVEQFEFQRISGQWFFTRAYLEE
jgi:hypothetical protein